MKRMKNIFLPILITSLFIFVACEDEEAEETAAESGTISGIVTFTGTWPDTGDVSISLQTSWPPTGPPYTYKVITEDNLNTSNQYDFSFEAVAFRTYKALAVSWEDLNDPNPATNQHTLGTYGGTVENYFMDPDSIVVSVDHFELIGLDFEATFY